MRLAPPGVFALAATALLLLASIPIVAAQSQSSTKPGEEIVVPDVRGDAMPFGLPFPSPGGVPDSPATNAVDLTSMRVWGEDLDGINIEIKVVSAKDAAAVPIFGGRLDYRVQFKLEGPNFIYDVNAFIDYLAIPDSPTGIQKIGSRFCLRDATGRGCLEQRAIATIDWGQSAINLYIPKASLIGRDALNSQATPPATPVVGVGSRLTDFRVFSTGSFPTVFADFLPNSGVGGPYILGDPVANDRIRLRVNAAAEAKQECPPICGTFAGTIQDFPRLSVTPGRTSLIQVVVINDNAGKRIINLTAQLADAAARNKWEVKVLSTLTLPGSTARIVNLIVNATNAVEHGESTLVRVVARSLGFADELGVVTIRVVGSVPPAPGRNVLFLHGTRSANDFCGGLVFGGCPGKLWLNTIQQDAAGSSDKAGVVMVGFGGQGTETQFQSRFTLDTPLVTDLVLDGNKTIEAEVKFQSDVPLSGTTRLELYAGDIFMGSYEGAWTSAQVAKYSFLPNLGTSRTPGGASLSARIIVKVQGASLLFVQGLVPPKIIPEGSKITLPVIVDPRPRVQQSIPLGPAFITLSPVNDTEEFVNPGKVRVFQLTTVNEGIQEEVVTLDLTIDSGGDDEKSAWYADFQPGSAFRLKPGDSVTFGVLVKAPKNAKEGDQCHILVNATSSVDKNVKASLMLTAIATTGVDVEGDDENYTVDNETSDKLADQEGGGKSPGLGFIVMMGTVAALAIAIRRRRA